MSFARQSGTGNLHPTSAGQHSQHNNYQQQNSYGNNPSPRGQNQFNNPYGNNPTFGGGPGGSHGGLGGPGGSYGGSYNSSGVGRASDSFGGIGSSGFGGSVSSSNHNTYSNNNTSASSLGSHLEQNLRSVIERIQAESRLVEDELRSNRPTLQALESFLETINPLLDDGRSLLRDWQVELAGGTDRRQKLLFEKLQGAFESSSREAESLKMRSQRSVEEQRQLMRVHEQKQAGNRGRLLGNMANSGMENGGVLDNGGHNGLTQEQRDQQERYMLQTRQEDLEYQERLASERNAGLSRIATQVVAAKKVFQNYL